MLDIKKLNSGYNKTRILKNIDFDVGKNEIIAVIGPNGSGKSTLLKSIFSQCDVFSGKIFFKKANIRNIPASKLIHLGISYIQQGRVLFNDMTVKENLEMGGFILDKNTLNLRINEALKQFPFIKKVLHKKGKELSGGEQQMLAISRALIQKPKLLLLDEPSLGLSPIAMKKIFEKIMKLKKNGLSIVIVEQNARNAVNISDRVYVLENGEVSLKGGKEIMLKLEKIYLG